MGLRIGRGQGRQWIHCLAKLHLGAITIYYYHSTAARNDPLDTRDFLNMNATSVDSNPDHGA